MPAKSNKGLGIEALNKMVIKPYFCRLSYKITFALYNRVLSFFVFK